MRISDAMLPVLALLCATSPAALAQNEDFSEADAALNEAYQAVMARLDGNAAKLLKTSQRAWLTFRDAECTFQGHWTEGGSIQPQIIASCWAKLSEERTAQLNAYLDCQEGDLTCPPAE